MDDLGLDSIGRATHQSVLALKNRKKDIDRINGQIASINIPHTA